MLTIGKLGGWVDQLAYYEQQVTQGIEDYFSGRARRPACGGISLSGRVDRDGFMRAPRYRREQYWQTTEFRMRCTRLCVPPSRALSAVRSARRAERQLGNLRGSSLLLKETPTGP
jgi:hypothetical protein